MPDVNGARFFVRIGPGWSKFASTSRAEFDYSTYSREAELEALPRSSSKRDGQDDAGKEVDNSLTRFLDSVATDDTKKVPHTKI